MTRRSVSKKVSAPAGAGLYADLSADASETVAKLRAAFESQTHSLLDVMGLTDTKSYLVSVVTKSCGCRVGELLDGGELFTPCQRHCADCCIPGKLKESI